MAINGYWYTVDTDVVVLAEMVVQALPVNTDVVVLTEMVVQALPVNTDVVVLPEMPYQLILMLWC